MAEETKPVEQSVTAPGAKPAEAAPVVAETKPETKPVEGEKPAEPAKPVAPEKYELKLPENSFLDPSVVEKVASFAKERGLSNEDAQKVLEQENSSAELFIKERSEAWRKEAINDKEIGGNEEQLNRKVALANRVVERFGDDTLKGELDKYGYGNHPGLIKLLSRVGETMSDDQFVRGGAHNAPKSTEELFYGNKDK